MNDFKLQTATASAFPEVVIEGDQTRNKRSLVSEYLSIANRRKWLILGTVVAFLIAGVLVTLLMTPLYKTSAILEIQRENRNFAEVKGSEQAQASADNEFYQTQYGLLKSRVLAERIARSLRLGDDLTFFEKFGVKTSDDMFENGRPIQTAAARAARIKAAGNLILARMDVEPERMSRLVEISFTSPDPELSKRVVDAWSTNFIQSTLERRYSATSYARNFLEERLKQLRIRIDEIGRAHV